MGVPCWWGIVHSGSYQGGIGCSREAASLTFWPQWLMLRDKKALVDLALFVMVSTWVLKPRQESRCTPRYLAEFTTSSAWPWILYDVGMGLCLFVTWRTWHLAEAHEPAWFPLLQDISVLVETCRVISTQDLSVNHAVVSKQSDIWSAVRVRILQGGQKSQNNFKIFKTLSVKTFFLYLLH